jgi:hypothetical protein
LSPTSSSCSTPAPITRRVTGTRRWFTSGTPNSANSRQASTTPKATTEEPAWPIWSSSPLQPFPTTYAAH